MADSAKAYLKKRAAARPSSSVVGVTTPTWQVDFSCGRPAAS
jgi:hypothetical protein